MTYQSKSIRTFIGSKNFKESRQFYTDLGFKEFPISPKMSYYEVNDQLGFYLQDYYVKDWINNSMVFLEVENLDECQKDLIAKDVTSKYKNVRLSGIKEEDWGRELFMHDPAGVLWHFGEFKPQPA